MAYQIVQLERPHVAAFTPYGGAAELWRYKGPEVILAGPAETGKTRSALEKFDALMWKYPGAQAAIIRKTRNSMTGSVLQTYENKVLRAGTPVLKYGGSKVEWYDYPNGSRVFVGGMDNPDKVLSAERDFIYVNQAEELTLNDWEVITTRATGRAGNSPYAQVMGDANPGPPQHWIKLRAKAGALKLLESRHEDNPTLFDPVTKRITAQGVRSLSVLDRLTGVRKERLRYGRWVSAEGVVYENYDAAVHLIYEHERPVAVRRRFLCVDFGFTMPFTCLWLEEDYDGRLFLYREIYMTRRLVEDHAAAINRYSEGERIDAVVRDHDAEDGHTLHRHLRLEGPATDVPAYKAITTGIDAVRSRLQVQPDGKARLYLVRDALVEWDSELPDGRPHSTENEFEVYTYPLGADGQPRKDLPVDDNNHGLDALRYGVAYADQLGKPSESGGYMQQSREGEW